MNSLNTRLKKLEEKINPHNKFEFLLKMYFEQLPGQSLDECIKRVNDRTGLNITVKDIPRKYTMKKVGELGNIFFPKGWSHDEFVKWNCKHKMQ